MTPCGTPCSRRVVDVLNLLVVSYILVGGTLLFLSAAVLRRLGYRGSRDGYALLA
jgi:hypothetical protein